MEALLLAILAVILIVVFIFLFTALFGAPYVPSFEKEAREAFRELRPLTKKDVVVDFGAGDGVVLRAAVRAGAGEAIGIEINPILATITGFRFRKEKRVRVKWGDMTRAKLPEDMTVVYVFGLDRVMKMIKPRIVEFAKTKKRDIYVVSKAFEFDGMRAEKKHGAFYLYLIRHQDF